MAKYEHPGDMVAVRHKSAKKSDPVALVSRRAHERIWKEKGWEIVERDKIPTTVSPTGVTPPPSE